MRTHKELFEIVLENLEPYMKDRGCSGICGVVRYLMWEDKITDVEWEGLRLYMYNNIPKECRHYMYNYQSAFWWKAHEINPRKEWIEQQIEKLKQKLLN